MQALRELASAARQEQNGLQARHAGIRSFTERLCQGLAPEDRAEARELIRIVQALMGAGASARGLLDAQIAHPAFTEGLQSALMRLDRFALK